MAYQETTDVFRCLTETPTVEEVNFSTAMPTIQRFIVLMYDCTSVNEDVNGARKAMFTQKG